MKAVMSRAPGQGRKGSGGCKQPHREKAPEERGREGLQGQEGQAERPAAHARGSRGKEEREEGQGR